MMFLLAYQSEIHGSVPDQPIVMPCHMLYMLMNTHMELCTHGQELISIRYTLLAKSPSFPTFLKTRAWGDG